MNLQRGEVRWRIPKPRSDWSPEQYISTFERAGEFRRVEVGLWLMKRSVARISGILADRVEYEPLAENRSAELIHDEILVHDLWPLMTALTTVSEMRRIRHPVAGNRDIMSIDERRARSEDAARNGFESAWMNLVRIGPGDGYRLQHRLDGLLTVVGAATYHLTYAVRPEGSSGQIQPKTSLPPRDYI